MRLIRQTWLGFFALVCLGLLVACGGSRVSSPSLSRGIPPGGESVTLTVSAASDLHYVFPEIARRWAQKTGHRVIFNFGSTGQLAQQIERGAPVDLFAAANRQFVEALDQKGLVFSETKALYGVGRLTLWQRADGAFDLNHLQDLTQPAIRRVAIANPDHAPYGTAAREALQAAGIWEELQPKLILAGNIKQAQQYAATGNVEVAIAALSISVENSVEQPGRWVLVPEDLHSPLDQMLVVPKRAPHPEVARDFAAFINGAQGRALMMKYGFALPGEGR